METWSYKLPGQRAQTHDGPVEFGDGILKLLNKPEGEEFFRTWKAYAPGAWEWAERVS